MKLDAGTSFGPFQSDGFARHDIWRDEEELLAQQRATTEKACVLTERPPSVARSLTPSSILRTLAVTSTNVFFLLGLG